MNYFKTVAAAQRQKRPLADFFSAQPPNHTPPDQLSQVLPLNRLNPNLQSKALTILYTDDGDLPLPRPVRSAICRESAVSGEFGIMGIITGKIIVCSLTPEQPDGTASQLSLELEAERRRNMELAEQLQLAEAARAEAAALLIRATNERAWLRRRADLADREAAASRQTASAAIAARDMVLASTTWRLTYPVRRLAGRLPLSVRRAVRGGAKLLESTMTLRLVRELRSRGLLRSARTHPEEDHRRPFDLVPPALAPPVDPAARRESVDIIVHADGDAAEIKACLDALIQFTLPPYRVVVLVDGDTGSETACLLRRVAIEQGVVLLQVGERKGYAAAANTAIRASNAAWVVFLKSGVVVSPDWLDRMWAHAIAEPKIGIIGPLSNIGPGNRYIRRRLGSRQSICRIGFLVTRRWH